MALPVTGPVRTTTYVNGPTTPLGYTPQWGLHIRDKWRQARPIDRPLPYVNYDRRILNFTCGSSNPNRYVQYTDVLFPDFTPYETWSYNKAYDRFKEKCGEAAELAVSLAERKQAMGMVSKRLSQMVSFGSYVARGRWAKAGKSLGMTSEATKNVVRRIRAKGIRKNANDSASAYLEFHFGWSPLVADIYSAVQVLGGDLPGFKIHATATSRLPFRDYSTGGPYWVRQWSSDLSVGTRLQAYVGVTNPNLALLNQLGLVNPATVLWELVPFSFVVDWFANVSDFLGGWTDFLGLTLKDAQWTIKRYARWQHYAYDGHSYTGEFRTFARNVGSFPGPTLTVRQPWKLSPRRGAAAAALLVQQLKRFH